MFNLTPIQQVNAVLNTQNDSEYLDLVPEIETRFSGLGNNEKAQVIVKTISEYGLENLPSDFQRELLRNLGKEI